MSFFVRLKAVSIIIVVDEQKNAYSHAESFRRWERFLKTTASLSNLTPTCFYHRTNLVCVSYPRPAFLPHLVQTVGTYDTVNNSGAKSTTSATRFCC